jgi:uncharacterized protein YkwD
VQIALTTRLALTLLLALAVLGATQADARPLAELAPTAACGGAASDERTQDSLLCFVNWARRAHGLAPVRGSDALARAAADKAAAIVRCGEFSHEPCGVPSTTSVKRAGYRYRDWGETLFTASARAAGPRLAVKAWLASPPHRDALLTPTFREAGAALVLHGDPYYRGPAGVWVLELGRR